MRRKTGATRKKKKEKRRLIVNLGIETNEGGVSSALVPILASFSHNSHFKGISLKNVSRPEVWKAAALIFKVNVSRFSFVCFLKIIKAWRQQNADQACSS